MHSCSCHHHTHTHETPTNRTIRLLSISFVINMVLTLLELGAGVVAGSMALIADALHNCSDAFSILIAVIAYKIGTKKATLKYTYGFRRAETIGGFVNLILLFVAGIYLVCEGIGKVIFPQAIDGPVIVAVSVVALIIDVATAKISHTHAHHNMNMKMLFVHNLADAFGSVGVIISGLCIMYFGWTAVDGIVATLIGIYMIVQSVVSFPKITQVLMNSAPDDIDIAAIKRQLKKISGIQNVHHIHVWYLNERQIALDCHIVSCQSDILKQVNHVLKNDFGIHHTTIQIETSKCQTKCCV